MNKHLAYVLIALTLGLPLQAKLLVLPLETPQRVMHSYNWDEYTFESVRFSPSGREVAVATDDGMLYLFESKTGHQLWQVNLGENVRLRGLVFAPDGKTIYTGEASLAAQVQAVQVKTGQVTWRYAARADLKGEVGTGTFAGINRDLSLDRQGNLYVMTYWTVFDKNKPVARTQVVSLDPQGQVRWRYPQQPLESTVSGGVSISPNGKLVAAVTGDFTTDFTRPNQGLKTLLLDSKTGKLLDQKLLAPDNGKPIATVCPPVFSIDNQSLLTLSGNSQAVSYTIVDNKLVTHWQKRFSQPQKNLTVYYKFLLAPTAQQGLIFSGTTAPLPAAQDEDPKQEHPNSNQVFLINQQGKIQKNWSVPSLDRPPAWDAFTKTLAIPIAQNTVTEKPRGLILLELLTGKTQMLLTTPGAVIAADIYHGQRAAVEVPLQFIDGKTKGKHQLYLWTN